MIVLVVALAAIITPPDPGSQILLAVPLLMLFEMSLLIMRLFDKRDAEAKAEASKETEGEAEADQSAS